MFKLFQSIFGDEKPRERYPESLVDEAIERVVDGSDPRLRALPGYRKRLRAPVMHAIDHVVALVDVIPPVVMAGRDHYAVQSDLSALFASSDHMLEVFGKDPALAKYLGGAGRGAGRVNALLMAEYQEKNILGMDLVGEVLRRDVAQVTVSFSHHRLLDPDVSENELRRALKRRAFDHLLTLALLRIINQQDERAELKRQRELLKHKLGTLKQSGWGFDEGVLSGQSDASDLLAELEEIESQMKSLGTDAELLNAHITIVADVLARAEQQLWAETVCLRLDRMNIKRDAEDESAKDIVLHELHNAQGRRLVMLLVSIAPDELPKRQDTFSQALRSLG